jgi:hypothetical protein
MLPMPARGGPPNSSAKSSPPPKASSSRASSPSSSRSSSLHCLPRARASSESSPLPESASPRFWPAPSSSLPPAPALAPPADFARYAAHSASSWALLAPCFALFCRAACFASCLRASRSLASSQSPLVLLVVAGPVVAAFMALRAASRSNFFLLRSSDCACAPVAFGCSSFEGVVTSASVVDEPEPERESRRAAPILETAALNFCIVCGADDAHRRSRRSERLLPLVDEKKDPAACRSPEARGVWQLAYYLQKESKVRYLMQLLPACTC